MIRLRFLSLTLPALLLAGVAATAGHAAEPASWPPKFPGTEKGAVTLSGKSFLQVPEAVQELRKDPAAAPFVVAKTAPTVDLAFHQNLGEGAATRRLWSSWGDICRASDGSVYVGIGDHGNAVGGDARCFLYRWDPEQKTLTQIVDMNKVAPRNDEAPAWSKVHARIEEGPDGQIYFSCTLNDGNRASKPEYKWTKEFPGGQIYRYNPETGKTSVFANLPAQRCTATSVVDHQRGVWWCCLEAGGGELFGLDLNTGKPVYQSAPGEIFFNRAIALTNDGSIVFNGEEGLRRYDPETGKITKTKTSFPDSPGMRSATRESKDGFIYGTTHKTNQLFSYQPAQDKLKLLGPCWLKGMYTTVMVLSPDEKYVYYLPGAHGQAFREGTPVIQYEIATGTQKVLAFLAETFEEKVGYVPGGTYGVKLSADGSTLYANLNGHPAEKYRPEKMRPNGFGVTSFVAIHIPKSER